MQKVPLFKLWLFIHCSMVNDIHTIHSDSQLMEALYADDTTTSDNIADMVRPFGCCRPVLQAVANLYLRRQIIFERLS